MLKIRVVLADDHIVVRQGLHALLASEKEIEISGEADNGRQAVQMVKDLSPDVVVMDMAMPLLNGLDATREITQAALGAKVLILSSCNDEDYVDQAIEAGAIGFLVKHSAGNELIRGIHEAYKGNLYFSPAIAKALGDRKREAVARGKPVKSRTDTLTVRQFQVLQLIAEGLINKEIAARLGISSKTVEKHRDQVMKKLGIHDIAGLTRHAVAKGVSAV